MSDLRTAFERFDKDASGSIEIGELDSLLRALTQGTANEEAIAVAMSGLVTARPDRVTWEELSAWWGRAGGSLRGTAKKRAADHPAAEFVSDGTPDASKIGARTVFDRFDVDGNGEIDIEELATLLEALGMDPDDEQLEAARDKLDADESGRLSWDEFRAWWERQGSE